MYTDEQYRDHVRELQEYLRALSATDERYMPLGVDGIFGPDTDEAVRVFQKLHDSPVTGTVQRADWERIVREYGELLLKLEPAHPISPFPDPSFVLRPGERDPIVAVLEVMLDAIEGTPTAVVYSEATAQRVCDFQRRADLPVTGEVDRIVWDQLAAAYERR